MKHHRIARGEFPVEVDLVLREPTLGTEERSWLGFGTMTSYLDIRKSAQGEKTWWVFDVEGQVRLCFATPRFDKAEKYWTSNCGEQDMILADVYDQSLYATPGFRVDAVRLVLAVIKFKSHRDLDGMFHHSYGTKGSQFLEEWYNREQRFFRGPSSAPYHINDPNGMEVSHINGQEVHPAQRPLNHEEELEEFGEIQDFSQPIY